MSLFGGQGHILDVPAVVQDVFDVTGAGDTVVAVLAAGMAASCGVTDVVRLANLAAGVAVRRPGVTTVTLDDLIEALVARAEGKGPAATARKIVPVQTLESLGRHYHARGLRVVFTHGRFDVLHPGYVEELRAARACGDVLVVGLRSDASVGAVKGLPPTSFSQHARADMLALLPDVDHVVIFDDPTGLEVVRPLRPDVHLNAVDHDAGVTRLPHAKRARRGMGSQLIPFLDGHSTTVEATRDRPDAVAPETTLAWRQP
jgi:D-beta-D-heptose 7-phosphate kinase/D-beta-D-heptose 1-phosphate adenosyltransferase